MVFSFYALVRFLHIAGAVMWLGGAAFAMRIIRPAVDDAGPTGKAFMMTVLRRGGYGVWFGPAAIVTVAAGIYVYIAGDHQMDPFATPSSAVLTVGVALGIVAFLLSLLWVVPLENKMKALVADIPANEAPTPEQGQQLAALADKMVAHNRIILALLGLTFLAMSGRWIVS